MAPVDVAGITISTRLLPFRRGQRAALYDSFDHNLLAQLSNGANKLVALDMLPWQPLCGSLAEDASSPIDSKRFIFRK